MADWNVLPDADRALIPRDKLERYVLDLEHETGRHKARVFAAALGIRQVDWEYLRNAFEVGVAAAPVASVRETQWGRLFRVVIEVEGLNGRSRRVLTVWLVRAGSLPEFVTAYVLDRPDAA